MVYITNYTTKSSTLLQSKSKILLYMTTFYMTTVQNYTWCSCILLYYYFHCYCNNLNQEVDLTDLRRFLRLCSDKTKILLKFNFYIDVYLYCCCFYIFIVFSYIIYFIVIVIISLQKILRMLILLTLEGSHVSNGMIRKYCYSLIEYRIVFVLLLLLLLFLCFYCILIQYLFHNYYLISIKKLI